MSKTSGIPVKKHEPPTPRILSSDQRDQLKKKLAAISKVGLSGREADPVSEEEALRIMRDTARKLYSRRAHNT